ncbi:hypothetical protein ZIOFF_056243 [Zingiber officinale]|uniref:Uncharacterized protein n=1 Tax=Zingiber officinale TaxID=94328 RepID=A0A8J5KF92_ZINOF|nr:hypothetical protein ZIOFF_056243 [Zingiber officinale]
MADSKGRSDERFTEKKNQGSSTIDDLIPGFGGSIHSKKRYPSSGLFTNPLENISRAVNLGTKGICVSSGNIEMPKDSSAFNGISESDPFFSTEINEGRRDKVPLKNAENMNTGHGQESPPHSPANAFENILSKLLTHKPSDFQSSANGSGLHKPPPLLIIKQSPSTNETRNDSKSVHQSSNSHNDHNESTKNSVASPFNELEDFEMSKHRKYDHNDSNLFTGEEEIETNSAAPAAMKEAMKRAEAKFRHAKEVSQRERDAKSSKNKEELRERFRMEQE